MQCGIDIHSWVLTEIRQLLQERCHTLNRKHLLASSVAVSGNGGGMAVRKEVNAVA